MSKHGLSLAQLKAKKTESFFDKVNKWVETFSSADKRSAYHCLLIFASEHLPLVHQDEVIARAQDLYYEVRQQRG